jgi:hypothetical protein
LLKSTIEDLRPLLRLAREEWIIAVGSHVTACTLCDTSWLTESPPDGEHPLFTGQEHHEATCLFAEIPRWLTEDLGK